jgi:hypothetical protein
MNHRNIVADAFEHFIERPHRPYLAIAIVLAVGAYLLLII